jgi:glycosyltransferase involved in cell wall biosynthesis
LRFIGSIETKNLGTLSNSLASIISAIKEETDLIVLFNIGLGIFIPILKLFNIKVITLLDGVEWERGKWGFLAKNFFKVGAFFNVKSADFVVADAFEIQKLYFEKYRRNPIMIPYGAEIRHDLSSENIEKLGLKPNGYYLLATRFVTENNPLFIIRNFLLSNSEKPLVVLGRNYYKSKYEGEIKAIRDDRIIFLGQITNRKHLYEFYKYSYCYVHGHSMGGTNPTMLEALANLCCVLALNTPFNQEMLAEGEFGLFFELDSKDFVDKINFLDTHPEVVRSFKEKAVNRILTYYNWESVTNKYLSLLVSMSCHSS